MNSTRALIHLMGDQQLKACPPNIWPAFITTFEQHTERFAWRMLAPGIIQVVQDADGFGQSFPVCALYSSIEGEPFETVFSLS